MRNGAPLPARWFRPAALAAAALAGCDPPPPAVPRVQAATPLVTLLHDDIPLTGRISATANVDLVGSTEAEGCLAAGRAGTGLGLPIHTRAPHEPGGGRRPGSETNARGKESSP